jgi:uncharacterized protein (DUF2252 family)
MSKPWPLERHAVEAIAEFNREVARRFPGLLRCKYQRMAVNPFTFFRGTDHLFYQDLHALLGPDFARGPQAILQGDLHLSNFGTMPGPNGRLMIALNDFDEAFVGPVELDVKRFAASVAIAAREAGCGPERVRKLVRLAAKSYHETLRELAEDGRRPDLAAPPVPGVVSRTLRKAERQDPVRWLDKRAPVAGRWRRFVRNDHTFSIPRGVAADVKRAFEGYRGQAAPDVARDLAGYRITDMVSAIAGTGSVGRARYRVLLEADDDRLPLVFELKEEVPAAVAPFLPAPHLFRNEADRFVAACRLMNGHADPFMGTTELPSGDALESRSFFVRRLYEWKEAIDPAELGAPRDLRDLVAYYATRMALSHAGGASVGLAGPTDLVSGLGSLSDFRADLAAFSRRYARQVRHDHRSFTEALARDPLLGIPPGRRPRRDG